MFYLEKMIKFAVLLRTDMIKRSCTCNSFLSFVRLFLFPYKYGVLSVHKFVCDVWYYIRHES